MKMKYQKIKITPFTDQTMLVNFYFTIDLAAVDYDESFDEYQSFKIDLSNGDLHEISKQIKNNSLGELKLYKDSSYWKIEGDGFEIGIDDMGELVSIGLDENEKDKMTLYFNNYFYHICEEVISLSSNGIDLSKY